MSSRCPSCGSRRVIVRTLPLCTDRAQPVEPFDDERQLLIHSLVVCFLLIGVDLVESGLIVDIILYNIVYISCREI